MRVHILPFNSGPTCMLCSHASCTALQHALLLTMQHGLLRGSHGKHVTVENNS